MFSEDSSAQRPATVQEDAPVFRQLGPDALEGTHHHRWAPVSRRFVRLSRGRPPDDHPIHDAHDELCPGVIEKTQQFRDDFRPETLRFDSQLLLAYKAASPGSRAFKTRLIAMVAVAVHQIAVLLFKMDIGLHKDDGIADWAPPEEAMDEVWEEFPNGRPPTLFFHPWFIGDEQSPCGRADVVGYWTEARILGGVVLVDRRERGNTDDIYFHSDREEVTYRIYRLVPEQRKALLEFLTADPEPSEDLLPILGDQRNMDRVDPEEPIAETGIYRDIWEQKTRPVRRSDERLRDVWNRLEFPTHLDKFNAATRARERLRRQEIAEAMSKKTTP